MSDRSICCFMDVVRKRISGRLEPEPGEEDHRPHPDGDQSRKSTEQNVSNVNPSDCRHGVVLSEHKNNPPGPLYSVFRRAERVASKDPELKGRTRTKVIVTLVSKRQR